MAAATAGGSVVGYVRVVLCVARIVVVVVDLERRSDGLTARASIATDRAAKIGS